MFLAIRIHTLGGRADFPCKWESLDTKVEASCAYVHICGIHKLHF